MFCDIKMQNTVCDILSRFFCVASQVITPNSTASFVIILKLFCNWVLIKGMNFGELVTINLQDSCNAYFVYFSSLLTSNDNGLSLVLVLNRSTRNSCCMWSS